MPSMKAVIFDLDGTLLDTLDDLADTVNAALSEFGLPLHPVEAFRFFVGDGMETMVQRAAPEGAPPDTLARLTGRVKELYDRGWAEKTRPYAGIEKMLGALSGRVPLAVLSNKPHEFTVEVVRHYFPKIGFSSVQGSPPGGKAKPDPALALGIARMWGLPPGEILFLGDSSTDMKTAVAAQMFPAGALWGFRSKAELEAHGARVVLEGPEELLQYVG